MKPETLAVKGDGKELIEKPTESNLTIYFRDHGRIAPFSLECVAPDFIPGNPYAEVDIDQTASLKLIADTEIPREVNGRLKKIIKKVLKQNTSKGQAYRISDGVLEYNNLQSTNVTFANAPWKPSLIFCKEHPEIIVPIYDNLQGSLPSSLSDPLEMFQPEQIITDEGINYWIMDEREFKLNASADPRPWLRSLEMPNSDLYIGPLHIPDSNSQKFLILTKDEGICLLSDGKHAQPAIKYKIGNADKDGIFNRKETIVEYSKINLENAIKAFDRNPDGKYEFSPEFIRARLKRHIIFPDGFTFEVFADCCVPKNGDKKDLNQVEVEFAGQLRDTTSGNSNNLDLDRIQSHLLELRQILKNSLQSYSLFPQETVLTKFKWITE